MTSSDSQHEVDLLQGLRLEKNLALFAGAGAGKTHSLVTICLHLLSGARADRQRIECRQLGLVTFTEKAATEMRSRLRARLDSLADGTSEEVELRASFEVLGKVFPSASEWQGIRESVSHAFIGTFHSMCIQILQSTPENRGGPGPFQLLDERLARQLTRDVVEDVVLRKLGDGNSHVRAMVAEMGFSQTSSNVIDTLAQVYSRIREEGLSCATVAIGDEAQFARAFESAVQACREFAGSHSGTTAKQKESIARFSECLGKIDLSNAATLIPQMWAAISRQRGELIEVLKSYVRSDDASQNNLRFLYGAYRAAPFEATVREILEEVRVTHEALLGRRGVIDFTGLLIATRNLLYERSHARRAAQNRFRALLVDEFQDTNRLQLEIVMLLSEARDGAPRALALSADANAMTIDALPLEPGFLAIVGDRKQSIYEFRGSDVSVFETMTDRIVRDGGQRAWLTSSRRSSAALVSALNATMASVLGAKQYDHPLRDFEVAYDPRHDDLKAVRSEISTFRPFVTLSDRSNPVDAESFRERDAEAMARFVANLLESKELNIFPRSSNHPSRPVAGGDVAILFQRFTYLEVYRQALLRHGVRHRVVRGRGFYQAQEVIDVASILQWVADPFNAIAAVTVLRSPWVGLSDGSLTLLADASPDGRLAPDRLLFADELDRSRLSALLPDDERERFHRFCHAYQLAWNQRHILKLIDLLQLFFELIPVRIIAAGGPFGEQAVANIDKLMDLAEERSAQGTSVASFALQLVAAAQSDSNESLAEVIDEGDGDVVTLCTVHQAKGLEWPVVCLPDLVARPQDRGARIRFERSTGISMRPMKDDAHGANALTSARFEACKAVDARRMRAENLRLLYVAVTRARDHVIYGLMDGCRDDSWGGLLIDALGPVREANAVEDIDVSGFNNSQVHSADEDSSQDDTDAFRAMIHSVRDQRPVTINQMSLAVTQIHDFALCSRRYHLAHDVGLVERGVAWRPSVDFANTASRQSLAALGTVTHRLLELVPLSAVGTPSFQEIIGSLRIREGFTEPSDNEAAAWVDRFWHSPFGRKVAALGDEKIHREVPFALALSGRTAKFVVRGKIDLLIDDAFGLGRWIIDYKTSQATELNASTYRFQLGCYMLAAQQLLETGDEIQAGVVFMRDEVPSPKRMIRQFDAHCFEGELVAVAEKLLEAQRTSRWGGHERSKCEALGCGFVYRCHE